MSPNHETPYDKELLELYKVINDILIEHKITPDNKTAVRVRYKAESNGYWSKESSPFYIGKYDGIVSIGFTVCVENGYEDRIRTLG
jgi:penicillin-binding protein-related factor A (putative recombinase)